MSWLTGYQYRKQITISGSAGAGTGYQVLLKVGESDSTDADFNLEGHALNFPNDIRFTGSDGVTELSYYIESVDGIAPNRVANIWVKVADSLDADVNIYCYYGKSGDVSASDPLSTFLLFDNFEDGDVSDWTFTDPSHPWTADPAAAYEGSYGFYRSLINTTKDEAHKAVSLGRNIMIQGYVKVTETAGKSPVAFGVYDNSGVGYRFVYGASTGYTKILRVDLATSTTLVSGGTGLGYNNWYLFKMKILEDGTLELDNSLNVLTATDNTYTSFTEVYLRAARRSCWDLVLVRSYVEPEPSFSSAAAEEVAAGVAASISDSYSVWAYVFGTAQDSYNLFNYAVRQAGDVYAVINFASSIAADTYRVWNFTGNQLADSYVIFAILSKLSADKYAILNFSSGKILDRYTVFTLIAKQLLESYKISSFAAGLTGDNYSIAAYIVKELLDTYRIYGLEVREIIILSSKLLKELEMISRITREISLKSKLS